MSEKTNAKNVIIMSLATAIGAAGGTYLIKDLFGPRLDIDQNLFEVSQELNKTLPMILDSETRLDSTATFEDVFMYRYTLVNYRAEEIDGEILKNNMSENLRNSYCTADEMKQFLENDISVDYSYFGKDGKQVLKMEYQPDDCKNN